MLEDVELQHTDSTTYLGVTFDKRQTWRYHINGAQAKAKRKLALLRKLSGTRAKRPQLSLHWAIEGT